MNGEVHLVVLTLSEPDPDVPAQRRHVDLAPAIYDLDVGPTLGARSPAPDEVPNDFAEYIDTVVGDMSALSASVVMTYADEWVAKRENPQAATSFSADRTEPKIADLYARLLVDFADKQPELLCNVLVSMLVKRIESMANDPAFAEKLPRWRRYRAANN